MNISKMQESNFRPASSSSCSDFGRDTKSNRLRNASSTTSISSICSTISPEDIRKLTNWLETIPLTRQKKNINRDFSDGVLMAQLIAHFYPKMVELHNYAPACNASLKKNNWEVLNRKVFPKLGIKLTDTTIEAICLAKPNYIEQVLCQIHKLIFRKCEQEEVNNAGDHCENPNLQAASCLVNICTSNDAPEYVIFRGVTFFPEKLLVQKGFVNSELKGKVKELNDKVQRLETLIGMKESHLLELTKEIHELKLKLGGGGREEVSFSFN